MPRAKTPASIDLAPGDAGFVIREGGELELFMPQMGSMPPMRSKATLAESANGIYAGQIEFQMAWTWQTTITVKRGDQVIGTKQLNITAR